MGPGDLVIDVGAGDGAFTEPLVHRGARVVAVELHPGRAAALRRRYGSSVIVVQADAADLRLPRRPFKVVANPPFAVTMALVRRLVAPGSRLERADLIVPRHVARRWESGTAPGARRWERAFAVERKCAPPRAAFDPPPPQDPARLVVRRRV